MSAASRGSRLLRENSAATSLLATGRKEGEPKADSEGDDNDLGAAAALLGGHGFPFDWLGHSHSHFID